MSSDIVISEAPFPMNPLSYLFLNGANWAKTSVSKLKSVVPMELHIFSNAEHIRRCPVPCFDPIVRCPQLGRRIRAAKYVDPDLTRRRVVKVWAWGVRGADGTSWRFAEFLQVVIGPESSREAAAKFSRWNPGISKQAVLESTLFVESLDIPPPLGNWFLGTSGCRGRVEL